MKALSLLTGLLTALMFLPGPARGQGLPKVTAKAVNTTDKAATARATADRRAATYKGPKVVKNTEGLGKKILRDSKPAPAPVPVLVVPAKQ